MRSSWCIIEAKIKHDTSIYWHELFPSLTIRLHHTDENLVLLMGPLPDARKDITIMTSSRQTLLEIYQYNPFFSKPLIPLSSVVTR